MAIEDGAQADELRVLDELETYARECAGESASYSRRDFAGTWITEVIVSPRNERAREISIVAEQFLVITVGTKGGRFELGYDEDDVSMAKRVIQSVIAGRVVETIAPGRSRAVVTFEDGTTTQETGYEGWFSLPLILPFWPKWGRRVTYPPY